MGFLYLILVIAAAMRGGFWFATVISVASALCLNYFFAPPVFSFSISDPANWVALVAFELTALVISRLSQTAADRTAEAIRERRDAERLYEVSLRMFLLNRSRDPGQNEYLRAKRNQPGYPLWNTFRPASHLRSATSRSAPSPSLTTRPIRWVLSSKPRVFGWP
jgi:hypothetical protein